MEKVVDYFQAMRDFDKFHNMPLKSSEEDGRVDYSLLFFE